MGDRDERKGSAKSSKERVVSLNLKGNHKLMVQIAGGS